ncbi:unnamed protein product [Polarella glacialis]|uniref:Uncharacterized protein n=1 Tax=Polarella glacialis TaxID=89957 RepID=A0A813DY51_POLGL|nr:unnamed protein product [Polarella glacialis]
MPVPQLANSCPTMLALYFERASDLAMAAEQPMRARTLLHLAAPLRLMGLSRTLFRPGETRLRKDAEASISRRFHDKLKGLRSFGPAEREWQLSGAEAFRSRVQIRSLCDSRGANLENVSFDVTERNHKAYADRWGYDYRLHRQSPLQDEEPQFGKLQIALDSLAVENPPDWFLWLDCDALVTNHSISVDDLLDTYDLRGVDWAVAEETNGINSGVFLVRGGPENAGLRFLQAASTSQWRFVWDQSMVFHQMTEESDLLAATACEQWQSQMRQSRHEGDSGEDLRHDFRWAAHFRSLPQRAMNLYGEGSALQWDATAWEPGDFILHLAGCPLVEPECKQRFETAAAWTEANNDL